MQIYKLKAKFLITNSCTLHKYKSQMFRGVFGNTFRNLFCKNIEERNCSKCQLKHECEVARNFHNLVLEPNKLPKRYSSYSNLPPLYLFYISDQRTIFSKGDSLQVDIIFYGYPNLDLRLLTLILLKIRTNSTVGLKKEATLKLVEIIDDVSKLSIYSRDIFHDQSLLSLTLPANTSTQTKKHITFITPCRIIKQKIRIAKQLDERILQEAIYERLFGLSLSSSNLYEQKWSFEEINILAKDLFWTDIKHKSNRQCKELKIGGFKGELIVESHNHHFWDDISLLEHLHLGTNTQSGYGKFEISK